MGQNETAPGISRREALKKGAIGGALLWTVPTMSVLAANSASADLPSGPPPPPQDRCTPSHGLLVVEHNGTRYSFQINGTGLAKIGAPSDKDQVAAYLPYTEWNAAPSAVKNLFTSFGELPGSSGYYVDIPSAVTLVTAIVADGNLGLPGGNPTGLDYAVVTPVNGRVVFSKPC